MIPMWRGKGLKKEGQEDFSEIDGLLMKGPVPFTQEKGSFELKVTLVGFSD